MLHTSDGPVESLLEEGDEEGAGAGLPCSNGELGLPMHPCPLLEVGEGGCGGGLGGLATSSQAAVSPNSHPAMSGL